MCPQKQLLFRADSENHIQRITSKSHLESPPCDDDEFERVVLAKDLLVA